MKNNILGFNQRVACSISKTILNEKKNTFKTIKLDIIDLTILRWFIDFYPRMTKINNNNQEYAWINYKEVLKDMPILDIKRDTLYRRFQKMCELNVLTHYTLTNEGTYSYYGLGENYFKLIEEYVPEKEEPKDNEPRKPKKEKKTNLTKKQLEELYKNFDKPLVDKFIKNDVTKKHTYDTLYIALKRYVEKINSNGNRFNNFEQRPYTQEFYEIQEKVLNKTATEDDIKRYYELKEIMQK